MTYKESQAQKGKYHQTSKEEKPNEPIAWIASSDSYQSRTARTTHKEDPAPKEVPQEATAPVNKTVIAVLRIVKIVLRILIPQATKALIQKVKNPKRIHIK